MNICYLGNEERLRYLRAAACPGTVVDRLEGFVSRFERPACIESKRDEYLSIPSTLEMVVEAERRGFQAVLTGCFGDPGVDAARELVRIPVIGPGEASMHVASMLGHRFSILSPLESTVRPTLDQVRLAGLGDRLGSVRSVDVGVMEIREGREETYSRVLDVARACVSRDGADVLVLGCASISHTFGDRLAAELAADEVPVVNCVKASLKVAEMLVGMSLAHSKRSYPFPPRAPQSAGHGGNRA